MSGNEEKVEQASPIIWALIGYLFLFIFRPYEYWEILGQFRIERIYMLALFGSVLLWNGKRYVSHPINKAVYFFFSVMVVSTLAAYDFDAAYQATFGYFKVFIFYLVIILTVRTPKDFQLFLFGFVGVMGLYVGKSAWEFFIHGRVVYRMGISRMVGIDKTYGDPNSFAATIAYSLPFLWALIKWRPVQGWLRIGLLLYGGLAAVSLVYTGSRSGQMTVLLLLLMLWLGAKRKIVGAILLFVVLFFGWSQMPADYKNRILTLFVEDVGPASAYSSAQGRGEGFHQGIKLLNQYPLLGIGPGNFPYGWDDPRQNHNAHNLYGQLLGELGVAGAIAFATFFFILIRAHWSNLLAARKCFDGTCPENSEALRDILIIRYSSVACLQTIIMLLFNGYGGHNLYRYHWLWLAAMGVVMSAMLSDFEGRDEHEV